MLQIPTFVEGRQHDVMHEELQGDLGDLMYLSFPSAK